MDTSKKSENHENEDFSGCPKVKSMSYYPKMKQHNSTKLSGHLFFWFPGGCEGSQKGCGIPERVWHPGKGSRKGFPERGGSRFVKGDSKI